MLCRYARPEGLGRLVFERKPAAGTVLSLLCSFGLAYAVFPPAYLLIPAGIVIFSLGWSVYTRYKIGGGTGDTLGAAEELSELATVLILAIMIR